MVVFAFTPSLTINRLTPNVGLYWYAMMELRNPWKDMYRSIFILYSYIFIVPITWRYRSEPLKVLILSFLIQAILKTYPTLNDLAAPLSLLPMYSTSFDLFRSHPWPLYLFISASLLFPVLWFLWYDTLSGNLSYYYASTIFHNLAAILLLLDLFRAFIHDFHSVKILIQRDKHLQPVHNQSK